ncbi:PREDICTED: protein zyg-11 homolog B-like [Priapulus caudatus]|uniref:Protein zyg-11 homolog B-like n=1 Tax=Priapulus caudatus TaxID=37621 RepID=A0ABM1DRE3_PRICU|nr:PREDICTED: protein zyg-11 homolog B-like [Priapulus caudatus]
MHDNPGCLQDFCVNYISDNLGQLCELQAEPEEPCSLKLVFRDPDVFLHRNISERLLRTVCDKGLLDDRMLTLFDAAHTTLRAACVDASPVTAAGGLRVLRGHRIARLDARATAVPVADLVACLGTWSHANLQCLNLNGSAAIDDTRSLAAIASLRHLSALNVSDTELGDRGLETIVGGLPRLESIDLSGTKVCSIAPLLRCADRLRSLSLYNVSLSHGVRADDVLRQLRELRHLDVSEHVSAVHPLVPPPAKQRVQGLLEEPHSLPHLQSLDLSGNDDINDDTLREFVINHKNLRFLGLMLTNSCFKEFLTDPNDVTYNRQLVVAGEASERQLLEALRRYKVRPMYAQKGLYNLFSLTRELTEEFKRPRLDIIQLVLPVMASHPQQLGVQMAATACLYNLTKGDMGMKVHPRWLKQVVELTMKAMENFANHQQLQKNSLLTLCSDRILQDVSFDKFCCARLVMECLCHFDDASVHRMAVAICSILAAKISTSQTSMLGSSPRYMRKLLSIVKQKTEECSKDVTMTFTLSALWNLTDESPGTCKVVLEEDGLNLFMNVLRTFSKEKAVETKVLGLVSNLAEVKELRKDLMRDDFMGFISDLLLSEHIDVSYFAAGILGHMISDGAESWTLSLPLQEVLDRLGERVCGWKNPQGEMVAYRSFKPFFRLLGVDIPWQLHLWAVWAIYHVCSKNPERLHCL